MAWSTASRSVRSTPRWVSAVTICLAGPKDSDALQELLGIARGLRQALRDEMGAVRRASTTFDAFARWAQSRTVTRVTFRRRLQRPKPRPWPISANQRSKYCHRN
jgi:hypothetical protein